MPAPQHLRACSDSCWASPWMELDRRVRRYLARTKGEVMRTTSRVLARKLISHAAIGAVMSGALVLWLLMRELDLNRMILDGSALETTELAVIASLASLFAIGAGISAFIF